MVKKLILHFLNLILHLLAIAGLAFSFWPFFDLAIRAGMLPGFDTAQFFYYVNFFSQSHPLPPAGWDPLWFEGAPRVVDYVFLPHYLIQPLVAKYGLILATKIYPLFWLGFFFVACYFLFYRLSKNQLIAFLITLGVMYSKTIYQPIYLNGVVVSGLSNTIFPAIFLFLVLYAQTKSFRFLALSALALAFQLYNQAAMALTFGFVSASIFLFFLKFPEEKFISLVRVKRIIGFVLMTFSVAALTTFPFLMEASSGAGNYGKSPFGQPVPIPLVLNKLIEFTHPAVLVAFGLSIIIGIIFYKKQAKGMFLSFSVMLSYFLIFMVLEKYGINPVGDFLFPTRVFWYFAVILGCLSALLLAPLTVWYKSKLRYLLPLTWIAFAVVLMAIIIRNPFNLDDYKQIAHPTILGKEEGDKFFFDFILSSFKPVLEEVDQKDTNFRIWNHSGGKMTWNLISQVPQVEGYFQYMTKYSAEWTAWFNATLAEEVVKNKTIPQDMADKQALFLIDWYAAKYLYAGEGEEFNLAPRFYEKNDYVLRKSAEQAPAVFTIKPEYTSGIVEAVGVPLVGFVGSDDGYNIFIRNLGMLNLNTHYLVPLRLGYSINDISKEDLSRLKLLVIYGTKDKGRDWGKIEEFVKKGGSLFIETGGENAFREGNDLPSVFPADSLSFGSLGEQWTTSVSSDFSRINFKKLEPLIYQGEPWKLSYLDDSSVMRSSTRFLLAQDGKPVVTEQIIGEGKVIWSGVNSLYRPWELKKNGMAEVKIVEEILKKLIVAPYTSPIDVSVKREKAEKIEVQGSNFSGILVKEKNLPGWSAYAENNGNKIRLKQYAAGIDFMYFAVPQNLEGPIRAEINYVGRLSYWIFFIISIISLIFVSEEVISNGFFIRKISFPKIGKIFHSEKLLEHVKGWWEKDEDEDE